MTYDGAERMFQATVSLRTLNTYFTSPLIIACGLDLIRLRLPYYLQFMAQSGSACERSIVSDRLFPSLGVPLSRRYGSSCLHFDTLRYLEEDGTCNVFEVISGNVFEVISDN